MAVSTKQKQARKKKRISKHMQTAVPPPAAIPDELKGVELPTAPPKKTTQKEVIQKAHQGSDTSCTVLVSLETPGVRDQLEI